MLWCCVCQITSQWYFINDGDTLYNNLVTKTCIYSASYVLMQLTSALGNWLLCAGVGKPTGNVALTAQYPTQCLTLSAEMYPFIVHTPFCP